MNVTLKRIELILLALAPACLSLILFILSVVPSSIWGLNLFMPLLTLMPIFYWGRLQNNEMPYWFVFIIGVLTDAVSWQMLGLSSLLYLIFTSLLHSQSKYINKEGFIIVWGLFSVLTSGLAILQWLLISLLSHQVQSIIPALTQLLITIAIYPLFHRLFDVISEYIRQRRWIILHR